MTLDGRPEAVTGLDWLNHEWSSELLPEAPRLGLGRLHLQPLMDDQELDSRRSAGAVYREGAVRVAEDGREIGRGYLEMPGYGEKIRVG